MLAFASSLPVVFATGVIAGLAGSAINVGIFALRQRRTDPAWFGRAFAVSMSLNIAGQPVGSALFGPLLEHSIALPFLLYDGTKNRRELSLVAGSMCPRNRC